MLTGAPITYCIKYWFLPLLCLPRRWEHGGVGWEGGLFGRLSVKLSTMFNIRVPGTRVDLNVPLSAHASRMRENPRFSLSLSRALAM